MSEENFDVAQLAAYLHLTPEQVGKMAQRGRLPGRRVAGEWVFSEAEVHHWLERQIGAGDLEQLDKVDAVLSRAGKSTDEFSIADLCPLEVIEIPLQARTKGSVIRSMCDLAGRGGMLWDPAVMAEAVKAREDLHPTALDCGVALLHPRRPQTSILAESVVALGKSSQPLPFSDTGQLTDVFFLIASYDDRAHLRILSRISRMVSDTQFLDEIRSAPDAAAARQAILDSEERIDNA
ncbi:MAG: PTS sugar transporter subunit IIA [Pirellulaceae bacterium]